MYIKSKKYLLNLSLVAHRLSTHLIDHHLQEELSQLLLATIYCCQVLVCSSLCREVMLSLCREVMLWSQQTVGFVQLVVMVEVLLWTEIMDKHRSVVSKYYRYHVH